MFCEWIQVQPWFPIICHSFLHVEKSLFVIIFMHITKTYCDVFLFIYNGGNYQHYEIIYEIILLCLCELSCLLCIMYFLFSKYVLSLISFRTHIAIMVKHLIFIKMNVSSSINFISVILIFGGFRVQGFRGMYNKNMSPFVKQFTFYRFKDFNIQEEALRSTITFAKYVCVFFFLM